MILGVHVKMGTVAYLGSVSTLHVGTFIKFLISPMTHQAYMQTMQPRLFEQGGYGVDLVVEHTHPPCDYPCHYLK